MVENYSKLNTENFLVRDFMEIALSEAMLAQNNGDVPVGAIIVKDRKIISNAHNEVILNNNPLAHAEILAINKAMQIVGDKNLSNCDLYVTLEPCAMCAGAIVLAKIRRIYIGAEDAKTGACGSVYNILQDRRLNHYCEIYSGISNEKCAKLLSDFFSKLRENKQTK